MKAFGALGAPALALAVAGCSQPASVSGTYVYSDASGAVELVLTENNQQLVMGSMSVAALQSDEMRTQADSITGGTYDPKSSSLMLTIKPNSLLEPSFNATGMVAHGAIDLTLNGTTLHLTASSQQDFDAAVAALTQKGVANKNAKAVAQKNAEDIKTVTQLSVELTAYDTRILNSVGGPANVRAAEEKILITAQKDVHILETLKAQGQGGSYPASQVQFRVNQLDFQMGQIKYRVDDVLQQGGSHISGFDNRLAKSPCLIHAALVGCQALTQEQQRYAKVRERVEGNMAQLEADIQKNGAQMEALNHAAGN